MLDQISLGCLLLLNHITGYLSLTVTSVALADHGRSLILGWLGAVLLEARNVLLGLVTDGVLVN